MNQSQQLQVLDDLDTPDQATLRLAIGANKDIWGQRLAAIMSGVASADAALNNADVPVYSETMLALRSLVAFVDATGIEKMPAFAGMNTKPADWARELVKKAGL